jgi:hypothetical protein
MKTAETKKIYEKACAAKRLKFQQEEYELWHRSLKDLDLRDVETALDAWWISPATDSNGDLKSRWLPAPAELRGMALEVSRRRAAQASITTFMVCWRCPTCRATQTGFLSPEDRGLRFCRSPWGPSLTQDAPRVNGERAARMALPAGQHCDAEMQIMVDDRPRACA